MDIKNPILVTALYDIGRDNWEHYKMSYHTYLSWMKNTLSLDSKMVIYTENKFVPEIKKFRESFDNNLENTIIIEKPLNELYFYKNYYDKLKELMFSNDFIKKLHFKTVPEMCQPLYNIIMFNKLDFIKDCVDNKYFDNDMVIWVDAGGLREDIKTYRLSKWPSLEKINNLGHDKITFFSHTQEINIPNIEYHSLSQIRHIQGTSFLVPSKKIDEMYDLFKNVIDECINSRFIGSDEKMLDLSYIKNKNMFNLIKCGWREYFDILK